MTILLRTRAHMLAVLPEDLREAVARRFDLHAPLLLDRLGKLYGKTEGFAEWFSALVESICVLHGERSSALRAIDSGRASSPQWFLRQDMLGYCTYVDRFADSLTAVGDRIPHLRELGVTYLHLLPFLRARTGDNDGGFAVSSYDEIDPRLGSMADLEALTARLRDTGISLCADFVLNHVADDHPWALAAAAGDARFREFFHVFPDRTKPDLFERSVGDVFPRAAPGNFTNVSAMNGWVWTTFYPYQWDLNYANPDVFAEMAKALLRLANRGIEVFRLDSAPFLWKREGSNCLNQPEVHWILQAIRCIVEIAAPGVLLKAEAIVPTEELPPYFGGGEGYGRECHLAYHSSLMAAAWVALAEQDTELLCKVIDATPNLAAVGSWVTYVRCHDDIIWNVLRPEVESNGLSIDQRLEPVSRFFAGEASGSFASGMASQTHDGLAVHGTNGMTASLVGFERAITESEQAYAESRLKLLYGLALCFGGVPLIYMGDEIAQGNDYTKEASALRAADGRWLQRPRLDQTAFARRYDAAATAGRVFASLRHMVKCRQRMQVLAANAPTRILPGEDRAVLALVRANQFVSFSNFSGDLKNIDLTRLVEKTGCSEWFDCLSERPVSKQVWIEPWGTIWLEAGRSGDRVPLSGRK